MKRYICLLLVSSLCARGFAQSGKFIITGDLTSLSTPVEQVFISYMVNNQVIRDSAYVQRDKTYSLQGNIGEPVLAELRIRYRPGSLINSGIDVTGRCGYTTVFLEPGTISLVSVDSFCNMMIGGSKSDIEYRKLRDLSATWDERLADVYMQLAQARKKNDSIATKMLERQMDSLNKKANDEVYGRYAKENPGSPIALYALRNWAGFDIDASRVEPVFNALPAAVRASPSGREMQEKIYTARKTGVGQLAIDFTQADTLGRQVRLSALRGDYLLLDFWASWCAPCRLENPNLVKTYEKFHARGFQIMSISLDRPGARDKWKEAIRHDGMKWWHVSDLKYWNNAVARQYGIEAIPQNLLLDPEGRIIGKNLRGAELEKKLAEIYRD